MTTSPNEPGEKRPRDAAHWAQPVSKLKVSDMPAEATNLNVEGRQVVGPLQGFGQMWQKTYWVRLSGAEVTPKEVIKSWEGQGQVTTTCVDPKLQWSQAKNIWHNAAIRSALYLTIAPLRWARSEVSRR